MNFNSLNAENFLFFAMKHYDNPQSVTYDDFQEDLMRFKYLKRLFGRYIKTGVLRNHLILNHLIVLFNVFGDATIPLLVYKLEKQYWDILKTYLVYLSRYPEGGCGTLDYVEIDPQVSKLLTEI
mgnify:FL=1